MPKKNPFPLLVAGPAGSGKTTLGTLWARRCGARYIEGDDYHSPSAVARMRSGVPVDEAYRTGWLDRLVDEMRRREGASAPVLACSALKLAHRERLRAGVPGLRAVVLEVPLGLAEQRVGRRSGHYMPASLVASQFAVFERPSAEPDTLVLDGSLPPAQLQSALEQWLDGP